MVRTAAICNHREGEADGDPGGSDFQAATRLGPCFDSAAGDQTDRRLKETALDHSLGSTAMSHIFISYASADREAAGALARALESHGWSVWWDRVIPPGRQFDEVIEEALDSAHCVVVLWSNASVSSTWVKTEAAEGMRRRILIPALIENVKLPLEFRRVQTADLSKWRGSPSDPLLNSLLNSIEGTVGAVAHAQTNAATESAPESPPKSTEHSRAGPGELGSGVAQPGDSGKGKSRQALAAIAIGVVVVTVLVLVASRKDRADVTEPQKLARTERAAGAQGEQERPSRATALEGPGTRMPADASEVVATRMAGRWRTKTMTEKEGLRITSSGRNVTVAELNGYGQPAATWKGTVTNGVFEGDYFYEGKKIGQAKLRLSEDGQTLSGTVDFEPNSHVSAVYFRQ